MLVAIAKTIFDREMSLSENRVRPDSILQNSSLIMGKQIINILPEGFVYPRFSPLLDQHLPDQDRHYESRPAVLLS